MVTQNHALPELSGWLPLFLTVLESVPHYAFSQCKHVIIWSTTAHYVRFYKKSCWKSHSAYLTLETFIWVRLHSMFGLWVILWCTAKVKYCTILLINFSINKTKNKVYYDHSNVLRFAIHHTFTTHKCQYIIAVCVFLTILISITYTHVYTFLCCYNCIYSALFFNAAYFFSSLSKLNSLRLWKKYLAH